MVWSPPSLPMIGFGVALATPSKTILYWAQVYYCTVGYVILDSTNAGICSCSGHTEWVRSLL
jgi:hypothetical protein